MRLPRDWLGPRDELIPIDLDGDLEPHAEFPASADAFWSEDAGALHDAVRAPARCREPDRGQPAGDDFAPAAPGTMGPAVTHALGPVTDALGPDPAALADRPAAHWFSPFRRAARIRGWLWAPVVAVIGAIIVLAAIGSVETPGRLARRPARHASAQKPASVAGTGAASTQSGSAAATPSRGQAASGGVHSRAHRRHQATATDRVARLRREGGRRRATDHRTDRSHHAVQGLSGSGSEPPSAAGLTAPSNTTAGGGSESAGSSIQGSTATRAGTGGRAQTTPLTPSAPNQNGSPAAGGPPPP